MTQITPKSHFAKFILVLSFGLFFQVAHACHGLALIGLIQTNTATAVNIDANSDGQSCGCGPYHMEVELVTNSNSFTGTPPIWSSGTWNQQGGTWWHSLLNIPNYNQQNNWQDNCVIEPYLTMSFSFATLCPGTTYYWRAREAVALGTPGPWTQVFSFTTPGGPPSVSVTASSSSPIACPNSSVTLTATPSGLCSGNYSYAWSPTIGLGNPNALVTSANVLATTTYTVLVTDLTLNLSATSTVTVTVPAAPVIMPTTMIESTCNGATGILDIMVMGNPPYTYLWTPSNQMTQQATNLASGLYTVMIVDGNGCTSSVSITLGDSCDFVWPGDANDDAVANMSDVLDIALVNGAMGSTRPNASLNWIGQPSTAWGQTLNGIDYKWIDCDGNGTVNLVDTNAVIQNYGFTHNNRYGQNQFNATNPSLRLNFTADTLSAGSTGFIDVYLGDAQLAASNIYGLTFSLNFDATQLLSQSMSMDISNSWLGVVGNNLTAVKYTVPNSGQFDLAVTRYNQTAVSGNGLIARIPYTSTNALIGSGNSLSMPLSITNLEVIDNAGNLISVNVISDTLVLYDPGPLGIGSSPSTRLSLPLQPNPANDLVNIYCATTANETNQIRIYDPSGRLVFSQVVGQDGWFALSTSHLPEGMYLVEFTNGTSVQRNRLVVAH
ncbi:MAG: T9SS type A sorting domain-containing protein [Bacteroidia bacterium]